MAKALLMEHSVDPRLEIEKDVAEYIKGFEPMGALVVVGVYERPDKTKSGLYIAAKTKEEDKYQGKVGLVLAMGPLAFQEDASHRWAGKLPQVGDWVVYRIGDTTGFELGERRCRFVEDVDIKAIVAQPDIIL